MLEYFGKKYLNKTKKNETNNTEMNLNLTN